MRIDLGNGQFADVKEVSELRDGDKDAVSGSYRVAVDPETNEITVPGNRGTLMRRALLCRIITGWNLQFPLPSKRPDSLDKLTFEQSRALRKGTDEHFKLIVEQITDENADPTEGDSLDISEIS